MFYYNTANKGEFTNNEKLAQLMVREGKWASYGESEEEYVMQSDGSGYVLKSEYIEPEIEEVPTVEDRFANIEQQVADMNDAMLEMMFGSEE